MDTTDFGDLGVGLVWWPALDPLCREGEGLVDVIESSPRLPDGTPFPTLFYLTCPHATAACSRLESAGVMRDRCEDRAVVKPRS